MMDTGFRLADIGTSSLAMPYATVSNGTSSRSSITATPTIRTGPFERAQLTWRDGSALS
jgi:hypothetical protein